ncbi:MAG TPA: SigE family RNA polymerase sigma factor [Nocardioides sp.]|nr:SigE family RNA polymerase sigma factor [Nocardioides sp.]
MGEDDDFSAFAGARWAALVRSAVFLGCTLDEAQDLAQVTLVRCFVSWRKILKAEDPDAYVYKVMLNAQRDSKRRRWWGETPTQSVPERTIPTDPTEQLVVTDAIHRALAELSPVNRQVVVLRYFAELSESRTAQVLGIPPGTVKSRLSRALSQLATNHHLAEGSL